MKNLLAILILAMPFSSYSYDNFQQFNGIVTQLSSSSEVNTVIQRYVDQGFEFIGVVESTRKAFGDAKEVILNFRKFDYSRPRNTQGLFDPTLAEVTVTIEGYSSKAPVFRLGN